MALKLLVLCSVLATFVAGRAVEDILPVKPPYIPEIPEFPMPEVPKPEEIVKSPVDGIKLPYQPTDYFPAAPKIDDYIPEVEKILPKEPSNPETYVKHLPPLPVPPMPTNPKLPIPYDVPGHAYEHVKESPVHEYIPKPPKQNGPLLSHMEHHKQLFSMYFPGFIGTQ